jgi:hypothetical protein
MFNLMLDMKFFLYPSLDTELNLLIITLDILVTSKYSNEHKSR